MALETAAGIALKKAGRRTADRFFDELMGELRDSEVSDDEAEYIRRSIQVLVKFETNYKTNIEYREPPDIQQFSEELEQIGNEAAELAAVGELRGYLPRSKLSQTSSRDFITGSGAAGSAKVRISASAMAPVAKKCLENTDDIGTKDQAEQVFESVTASVEMFQQLYETES